MAFYAGQKLKASNLGQLSHTAQSQASVGQLISNATDTVIAFGTDNRTSSYVTKAALGSGHKFTLNASGLWAVAVTVRFPGVNTVGERNLHLEDSLGLGHHSASQPGDSDAPSILHVSFVKYLTANDYVYAEVYQSSGGNITTDSNALAGWGRIDLALVLKE